MKKLILLLITVVGLSFSTHGQKSIHPKQLFDCGSDLINRQDPNYLFKTEAIDKQILEYLSNPNRDNLINPPSYILPVVVHIIHENGNENISDQQVEQGIEDLNQAFENIGYYDPGTGVNTQIQFCLAKRDVEGNLTTGINRIESAYTNVEMNSQDYALKQLIQWDPLSYINIWLVKEICSSTVGCAVAGYAYYPSAHGSNIDGIVLEARWFGSSKANSSAQIHEMGHYLGLYHTFQGGCSNNNCQINGDRVCDTPPDNSIVAVPCNISVNSCNTDTNSGFSVDQNDMFWNYMDYGDWDCYSAFTQGQKERMQAVIEGPRQSLLESNGCSDPCLSQIVANFLPIADQTISVGSTINFTNTTTNATIYNWTINGTSFSQSINSNYTFNEEGPFTIALEAYNQDENCFDEFSINVYVVCGMDALFSTSNGYPQPGEIVTFENQSTNATNYTWTVNGETISTGEDFTYSFPQMGNYTICLEAQGDFCSDTHCQIAFVFAEADSTCNETSPFEISYVNGTDGGANCILELNSGDLLVGSKSNEDILVVKLTTEGDVLWERKITSTEGYLMDKIVNIYEDSNGDILLAGYGGTYVNNNIAFVMKFNANLTNTIWSKSVANNHRFYKVLETEGDPMNYTIIGDSHNNPSPGHEDDAAILKLNKNTGNINGQILNYNLGSSESFHNTILHNNYLYTIGRYTFGNAGPNKMRIALSKLDANGQEIWSKMYFLPESASARLYGVDLLIEDENIFFIAYGDDNGTSSTNINSFFGKTNLDGELEFIKKYTLNSNSFAVKNIKSVPNGFILIGNNQNSITGDFLIMKVDKTGEPIWSKNAHYLSVHPFVPTPHLIASDKMIISGTNIFVVGESDNGASIISKMDLNGITSQEGCMLPVSIAVTSDIVTNPTTTNVDLIEYGTNYPLENLEVEVTETESTFIKCGCDIEDNCEDTFIQAIGTPNLEEKGRKILITPDNNILIGGAIGDSSLLIMLDQDENILWERSFKFVDLDEYIQDMFIDTDGYLVGIGTTPHSPTKQSFYFKYDYLNDEIIWAKELVSNSLNRISAFSIVESNTDGNYFISGETLTSSNGCDAILLEVDKTNGNSLWNNSYNLGNCEFFYKVLSISNSIYTFGRNSFIGFGGVSGFRGSISKFDENGFEQWSKMYLIDENQSARLYLYDAIIDNGIVALGFGDFNGTQINNYVSNIVKTDYEGNIIWANTYQVSPGNENEYAFKIINLPDGYLITGRYKENDIINIYLLKIDKEGNVIWTKSIGGTEDDLGYDITVKNGFIYLLGETSSYGINNSKSIFLGKLDFEGNVFNDCVEVTDLDVEAEPISNPYQGIHELTQYTTDMTTQQISLNAHLTQLEINEICYDPCISPIDSCLLVSDALIYKPQINCNAGNMVIQFEVCNLGNQILSAETPFVIYDNAPFNTNATSIYDSTLGVGLLKDSCIIKTVEIPSVLNQYLYFALNVDPNTPTPFDPNLEFPNTGIEECFFENNIDSIILNHTLLPLDLGQDTLMCDNATLTFDAGTGFSSYLWSDNSTEQTITAYAEGLYWVEVIDECGMVQRDSIHILIAPQTELVLPEDLTMCPGELQISVDGFTNYQWFPSEFIDCDTCDQVTIDIDQTIEIIAIGNNPPGCYSADTLVVYVADSLQYFDTIFICFGETTLLFDNIVSQEGWYTQTIHSVSGCDTTFNTYLDVNDVISASYTTIPEVSGQSNGSAEVTVEGGLPNYTYEWSNGHQSSTLTEVPSGAYELTITDSNGCTFEILVTIPSIDKIMVEFPNIFSPNGDNLNDDFGPKALNYPIEDYTLEIYDRWGSKIFESNDTDYRWDGKNGNFDVPPDAYIYLVKYKDTNGELITTYGDVTVVR